MKGLRFAVFTLVVALWPTACPASDREQLPGFLENSYIGLDAGYGDFGFADANLAPDLHATRILSDQVTLRVSAGHDFSRFLAVHLSLLRPILWVEYRGVYSAHGSESVWSTTLALTARPMLPLGDCARLYADIGPAYIARRGFTGPAGQAGIPSDSLLTALTGAGVLYRLGKHWNADAGAGVVWPVKHADQPTTVYGALGLQYLFGQSATRPEASPSATDWPVHELDIGFFDRRLFYWDIAGGLSSSVPLFFNGGIKVRRGETVFYERNFFHTARWISLNWGASAGRWVSRVNGEQFYTVSVYPTVRLWPVRNSLIDFYVGYSLAGPSYLSRSAIDRKQTGGDFTFQDYIDVGALLGREKRLKLSLRLLHYSNGNLRTSNPGVSPPVTLNVGGAW